MNRFLEILQYFPFVLGMVVAVEQTFTSMPGKDKKDVVLASIQNAAKIGEMTPNKNIDAISLAIDVMVQALNATGVFHHGVPQPPLNQTPTA